MFHSSRTAYSRSSCHHRCPAESADLFEIGATDRSWTSSYQSMQWARQKLIIRKHRMVRANIPTCFFLPCTQWHNFRIGRCVPAPTSWKKKMIIFVLASDSEAAYQFIYLHISYYWHPTIQNRLRLLPRWPAHSDIKKQYLSPFLIQLIAKQRAHKR